MLLGLPWRSLRGRRLRHQRWGRCRRRHRVRRRAQLRDVLLLGQDRSALGTKPSLSRSTSCRRCTPSCGPWPSARTCRCLRSTSSMLPSRMRLPRAAIPKHAAVAVTRGILDLMDYNELEGVLAHELAHVKQPRHPHRHGCRHHWRCVVVRRQDGVLEWPRWSPPRRQRRSRGSSEFVAIFLAPLAAMVIQMALCSIARVRGRSEWRRDHRLSAEPGAGSREARNGDGPHPDEGGPVGVAALHCRSAQGLRQEGWRARRHDEDVQPPTLLSLSVSNA